MAAELKWQLRPGAVVLPADMETPSRAGWRTGTKPAVDMTLCVQCLICWIHCPDTAVQQAGGLFTGFDHVLCKGCEICTDVCPTDAIVMVPEDSELEPGGILPGKGAVSNG